MLRNEPRHLLAKLLRFGQHILLHKGERTLRHLRRFTPLRRLYLWIVDPRRAALFRLTNWVREGIAWQTRAEYERISFEAGRAWVRTPGGLEIAFMSEVPGGGLDADLYAGAYAPVLTRTLAELLPRNAVVLDVGANVGWITLNVARACPEGHVYAFEASRFTFRYLQANVDRNNLGDRVTTINRAVSDVPGAVQFVDDALAHATSHLQQSARPSASATTVDAVTLDDFVAERGLMRIDLIKCDVEGAELLVLRGASATLAQCRPILVLEVEARWLERFSTSPDELIAFLTSQGYEHRVEREAGEVNWIFTPRRRPERTSTSP